LETKSGNILHFLLKDLIDWVSTALQDVDQVHDLFLSKLKEVNFIGQLLAAA
jgi:hypothetical protein